MESPEQLESTLNRRLAEAMQYFHAGCLQDADRICRGLLNEDSALIGALSLRAIIAFRSGDAETAVQRFEHALSIAPDDAGIHCDFCRVLAMLDRPRHALEHARQATTLAPDRAQCWVNLGVILSSAGEKAEAIEVFRRAVKLAPDQPEPLYNLAVLLDGDGQSDEAITVYRRTVTLKPGHAGAWNNLGAALRGKGRYDEAIQCYLQALNAAPRFANALSGLGLVYQEQGRFMEALECFEQAMKIDPNYPGARFNHAILHLKAGRLTQGWDNFEARWETDQMAEGRRVFPQPAWDGTPGNGRTILICAEQGFGDTFQFIRYAAVLRQCGFRVILQCAPALKRLLGAAGGIDRIVDTDEPLPSFDVHAAMMSLPRLFGTDLETIPADIPYLYAEPEAVSAWRERIGRYPEKKIGICWRGNPRHLNDRQRSLEPALFADIARLPGLRLFSLQKFINDEDRAELNRLAMIVDLGTQFDPGADQFIDTAAAIVNLDLIITVDTSVAHLAGALGRPVWVLLPLSSDWRWMQDRDDSPWYPTMRLFRQHRFGDWCEVFARVQEALNEG